METNEQIDYINSQIMKITKMHRLGTITQADAENEVNTLNWIRRSLRDLESIKTFMAGYIAKG